jgi:glutaredoxin
VAPRAASEAVGGRVVTFVLGCASVVCLGILGYLVVFPQASLEVTDAADLPRAIEQNAASPDLQSAEENRLVKRAPPCRSKSRARGDAVYRRQMPTKNRSDNSEASDRRSQTEDEPTPEPLRALENEGETEQRDRARREEIERDRAKQTLEIARKRVDIVMYATGWCPVCTRAREYMVTKNISFIERDVDANPADSAALRKLNPAGSVPTITIDDEVLIGFSGSRIEKAIARAARQRASRF